MYTRLLIVLHVRTYPIQCCKSVKDNWLKPVDGITIVPSSVTDVKRQTKTYIDMPISVAEIERCDKNVKSEEVQPQCHSTRISHHPNPIYTQKR